jgi:glycosyltransferase involved in cell wall biosynthesis
LARGAGLPHVPLDFHRLRPLARSLADVIDREHVDIVNSHETRDRRALVWLRWRGWLPQPFVVTRHTMPLTSPPELLAVGLTADRTIAVSHAVARGLRRRLYPGARLRVVPNGIDLARVDAVPSAEDVAEATAALGDARGRPVIVVLARRKDQHILISGLTWLSRPVVVLCVGIEPDAEIRVRLNAVPERHRVAFVPFTDAAQAFYRLATVAALPSRIEGFSLSLLEAMAHGLPVVVSNAGGNPDLVTHGETGLLVPPVNPRAWADALEHVLGDPVLAGKLGCAARARVRQEYTLDRTVERTEGVYREALSRRRHQT